MPKIKLKYRPRPIFEDFHKRKQRWAVIVAHRRAGKTVACINELIVKALLEKKSNSRYAYIAPYYAQAKSIAFDYLMQFSEPFRVKHNVSELWVELINGARIRLYGADNPDALRGLYLDGLILDEYADMKPSVWGSVLRPLLSDRMGWAVFIGTPKGHNAFYDIYQYASLNRDDWYCKTLRASQTNIIPQPELDDALRSMTVDQFQQEFECSFEAAILGAIYGTELRLITDAGRITKVEADPMYPVHTAWDLGVGDSTAIWFYQVLGQGIRIIDFHEDSGEGLPYYAKILDQRGYKYGDHWAPHDIQVRELGSGKSRIETAKMLGIQFRIVPNLSIDDGINAVRNTIPRCWIDAKKCELGLQALRNYRKEYDDRRQEYKPRPLHDWSSHAADAFRYLAVGLKDKQKAKSTPQPKLQLA